MSGGVWFVVCIPTQSHEKELKYPPEDAKEKSPGEVAFLGRGGNLNLPCASYCFRVFIKH